MGDMRSRTLMTRIQTMRTSTMIAVGTLVVLMLIFYIKDSSNREIVTKGTSDRYSKLEIDSAPSQKDKGGKDIIAQGREIDVEKKTFSSKSITTTSTEIPTTTREYDEDDLEILQYKKSSNDKSNSNGYDKNTVNVEGDDGETSPTTPRTPQTPTTPVSKEDADTKLEDGSKSDRTKDVKDRIKKTEKDKTKTERSQVKTEPEPNDLPNNSVEKNLKQNNEDVQNKKSLIDILGTETKKLESKLEKVDTQLPDSPEKSNTGNNVPENQSKNAPLLQMNLPQKSVELPKQSVELPQQSVDILKIKYDNSDKTENQPSQSNVLDKLPLRNAREDNNDVQAELRNLPKLSVEGDDTQRAVNKVQESATPNEADRNDIAAQIKMLALKYSITLNETDSPRQNETYTKRLRNKLIQTGRFDLLEGKNCKKRLPKCIIIGVMKSGTEAFSTFLGLHPQVAMQFGYAAMVFFSGSQYENGLEWYRERMMCSTKDQITMEKSPQYFSSQMAPKRIHSMDPNIKLILLVRDPIARALSHFLQQKSSNPDRLRAKTFEECVYNKKTKKVISDSPYIQQSTYSVILKHWLEYFSISQILIVDGDTFRKNPMRSLHKAENFLGIDSSISKDRLSYNEEKGFYCLNINSTEKYDSDLSCLGSEKGRTHPSIEPEVKNALLQYFRPYNKKFKKLTGMEMEWN